jgi:hypothetical protein
MANSMQASSSISRRGLGLGLVKFKSKQSVGKWCESRSIFWHFGSPFMGVRVRVRVRVNYGIVGKIGLLNFETDFSS